MSFSSYQSYKNSGVDWLGKIPGDWSLGKFRHLFTESSEKIESEVHGEMLSVSGYRGIEVKEYSDENQKRTEENLIGYRIVHEGQLVVNTMWLNYAGLGISQLEGHVSPAYRSYWVDSSLHKPFVHHLMRSSLYVLGYTKYLTGVRPNSLQMSRDDLMSFPILIPTLTEQKSIAIFLDHETSKIDSLIAEQEKLIGLLKEKRQAVISHAVTKGLEPKVKMKDSGVEWLGEVPEHWSSSILRRSVKEHKQGYYSTENYVDQGVKLLRITDLNGDGTIAYEKCPFVNNCSELNEFLLKEGDFVFARTGGAGTFGKVGEINENVAFASYLIRFRFSTELLVDFLNFYFQSDLFIRGVESNIHGGVNKNIHAEDIKNQVVVYPDLDEQRKIAAYLKTLTKKYVELIDEALHVISILKERRSALISAAVTGQIDVRNYQPKEAA